ncbi:hypothetical protein J4211_02745 [Candidatus Woesearchaeota archaeon]|nr:hypothetical protein [Candidatus Woesearchaeota archaeon]
MKAVQVTVFFLVLLVAVVAVTLLVKEFAVTGMFQAGTRTIIDPLFKSPQGQITLVNPAGNVIIVDSQAVKIKRATNTIIDPLFVPAQTAIRRKSFSAIIDPLFIPRAGQIAIINDRGQVFFQAQENILVNEH